METHQIRDERSGPTIRPAVADDLPAIDAIYHHYVLTSAATFELETTRRTNWFAGFDGRRHRCLVAHEGADLCGYACSTRFRPRGAYATSVEVSVYLHPASTGRGLGTRLYRILLEGLRGLDLHRAYAGITLPNEASLYFFAFGETAYGFEGSERPGIRQAFYNIRGENQLGTAPAQIMRARAETWKAPKEARMVPRAKAAHAYRETVRRRVPPVEPPRAPPARDSMIDPQIPKSPPGPKGLPFFGSLREIRENPMAFHAAAGSSSERRSTRSCPGC